MEANEINTDPIKPYSTKTSNIKCCNCGLEFNPGLSNTNMCIQCVSEEVVININHNQGEISFCRYCKRFNKPPYIYCERESKELLSLCLKKIKDLNHLKINDASFIWTEPHSRRISLRLTVQKELKQNTFIQKSVEVEFTEVEAICDECRKEFTPHTWTALVQVRQKVEHKRTFFYLEQMILKNNANEKCLKVKEEKDGLDFFFKTKSDAIKFLDFIQGVIAMQVKTSNQLISQDDNSNKYNYKYNFSAEIPKICKDDLVIILNKMPNFFGGANRLLICLKVSNHIHLLDPISLKTYDMSANQYFQFEKDIDTIPLKKNSTEFMVLSIKVEPIKKNKNNVQEVKNQEKCYEIEVARVSDWETFTVKSHLGNILKENNIVLGFELNRMTYFTENEICYTKYLDIILVKKIEDKEKKQGKSVSKKVKRLEVEGIFENNIHKKNQNQEEKEQEFEEFLEEEGELLEEKHSETTSEKKKPIENQKDKPILSENHSEVAMLEEKHSETTSEKKNIIKEVEKSKEIEEKKIENHPNEPALSENQKDKPILSENH